MVTAAEQRVERGKQEGERTGLLTAIELGLELKFGAAGLTLLPAISQLTDLRLLRTPDEGSKTAQTLAELRSLYEALTA